MPVVHWQRFVLQNFEGQLNNKHINKTVLNRLLDALGGTIELREEYVIVSNQIETEFEHNPGIGRIYFKCR